VYRREASDPAAWGPWQIIEQPTLGTVTRAAGEPRGALLEYGSNSNGEYFNLTLILPHGPAPSRAVAFPSPLNDPPDGPLTIPRVPEPAEDEEPANVGR
jgi:hypothetical protein